MQRLGMAEIHRLIRDEGRQGALAFFDDRRLVEIASEYMAIEESGIGFLYSGFTHVGLPHRRIAHDAVWQVETDHATMMVEPGRRPVQGAAPISVGVPYGSKARLILLFLQTEALRTGNREVELGRSLHDWLNRLGIPQGGKSRADVREQAERISRCRIHFELRGRDSSGLINQNIVDSAIFSGESYDSPSRFLECVKLSEMFYEQLRKHPVPVEEAAIRALNGHSQALDIYCWLAYRLHALKRPTSVSWVALKAQFGTGVVRMSHFKEKFVDNLKLAMAVYPEAHLIETRTGLTMHPARPPVGARLVSLAPR